MSQKDIQSWQYEISDGVIDICFIHSFIHSFIQYLLNAYKLPNTVPGIRNISINKTDQNP